MKPVKSEEVTNSPSPLAWRKREKNIGLLEIFREKYLYRHPL